MSDVRSFAARVHERFPEGLTGMFAIGGTRTTYILENNRHHEDPGKIENYVEYKDYLLRRYFEFIDLFVSLGGWNTIITLFGYQSFHERGEAYTRFICGSTLDLINEQSRQFYTAHDIDPYFVGIDTLLHLPEGSPVRELGADLARFQQNWPYQQGRRKVIWEIASIPLYSLWNAPQALGAAAAAELDAEIQGATDLPALHDILYRHYARAAYGTDVPTPHFYLGSNRNGDLKMRAVLPMALLCGAPSRLYYTPYPTLFITRQTMEAIIADVAFGAPKLRSSKMDYADRYTSAQAVAEYEHFVALRNDPNSTVGLTRKVSMRE